MEALASIGITDDYQSTQTFSDTSSAIDASESERRFEQESIFSDDFNTISCVGDDDDDIDVDDIIDEVANVKPVEEQPEKKTEEEEMREKKKEEEGEIGVNGTVMEKKENETTGSVNGSVNCSVNGSVGSIGSVCRSVDVSSSDCGSINEGNSTIPEQLITEALLPNLTPEMPTCPAPELPVVEDQPQVRYFDFLNGLLAPVGLTVNIMDELISGVPIIRALELIFSTTLFVKQKYYFRSFLFPFEFEFD